MFNFAKKVVENQFSLQHVARKKNENKETKWYYRLAEAQVQVESLRASDVNKTKFLWQKTKTKTTGSTHKGTWWI